jgi:hypothetical protein
VAEARHEVLPESGLLGDGLPPIPKRTLGALRQAGYIDTTEAGSGIRVALGPRCRHIAATWSIDLPPAPTDDYD